MLNKKQKFVDAYKRTLYIQIMYTLGDGMLCGTEMKALICIIRYCVYISFRFGSDQRVGKRLLTIRKCFEGEVGFIWGCEETTFPTYYQVYPCSWITYTLYVYFYVNVFRITQHDFVLMLKTKYLFNKGCFPRSVFSMQNRTQNLRISCFVLYIFCVPKKSYNTVIIYVHVYLRILCIQRVCVLICVTLRMQLKYIIHNGLCQIPHQAYFGRMRSLTKFIFMFVILSAE